MLKKKELDAIKKKLPKDGFQRIADKADCSIAVVQKTLHDPKRFNTIIIEKALEVIEDYKKEVEQLKIKVKEVVA